jgi:two-component system OmpR family response regulator
MATKHILFVDNDALLRQSLAFSLRQAGYHVSTAANAEDALALARCKPPDLILLDIGPPGTDGRTSLRALEQQQGIPVILVPAYRRELEETLRGELGADDYVTKPFDMTVLLAHIKAVLRTAI